MCSGTYVDEVSRFPQLYQTLVERTNAGSGGLQQFLDVVRLLVKYVREQSVRLVENANTVQPLDIDTRKIEALAPGDLSDETRKLVALAKDVSAHRLSGAVAIVNPPRVVSIGSLPAFIDVGDVMVLWKIGGKLVQAGSPYVVLPEDPDTVLTCVVGTDTHTISITSATVVSVRAVTQTKQTRSIGDTARFEVEVRMSGGNEVPDPEWLFNNIPLPQKNSFVLVVPNLVAADSGTYCCVVDGVRSPDFILAVIAKNKSGWLIWIAVGLVLIVVAVLCLVHLSRRWS